MKVGRAARILMLPAGPLLVLTLGASGVARSDSPAAADGQRKVTAGDYRGAISTLQSAVTQNPSDAAALYWLGRGYYEIRDYDNSSAADPTAGWRLRISLTRVFNSSSSISSGARARISASDRVPVVTTDESSSLKVPHPESER